MKLKLPKANMFRPGCISAAVFLALAGIAHQASAAGDPLNFDIATLQTAGAFVTYGDGQSYALQVDCTQTGQTGTGCIWYVQSSTGQIKNLVVNGAHSGGGVFDNAFDGSMDNAYEFPESPNNPNDSQLADWFIRTGGQTITSGATTVTFGSPDPGGADEWTGAATPTGTADRGTTWDTQLSALMDYTDNKDPVFFFVNNQTNSGDSVNQELAGWARLWITNDATGEVLGVWEFTNDDSPYAVVPDGGGVPGGDVGAYTVGAGVLGTDPDVVDNTNTDYVLSGGRVCFDQQGAAPALGDPIVECGSANDDYSVDNNLGDNQAAYALFFPEMNALIESLIALGVDLTKYSLHVDVRLGCDPAWYGGDPESTTITEDCLGKRLTNGGEALFIGAAFERPPNCPPGSTDPECQPPTIPEPGTISLLGMALALLGFATRRRMGSRGAQQGGGLAI
jgi:PEP-CTERM motif-containing protein